MLLYLLLGSYLRSSPRTEDPVSYYRWKWRNDFYEFDVCKSEFDTAAAYGLWKYTYLDIHNTIFWTFYWRTFVHFKYKR